MVGPFKYLNWYSEEISSSLTHIFYEQYLFAERYTTDVLIDRNEKKAFHIFIAPNRKITTKDLKDPVFLQRLALILLYPELNQTFLSVYEKTIANQAHSPALYHFDMDAPVLDNMQLDVDGLMYPEKKIAFRIERINTFENLETGIKKPITFHVVTQKRLGEIKDILGENKGKNRQGVKINPNLTVKLMLISISKLHNCEIKWGALLLLKIYASLYMLPVQKLLVKEGIQVEQMIQ